MTILKPTLMLALLPGLLLLAACGGDSGSDGTSPGNVPTATLPPELPEPIILDGTPGAPIDTSFAGDTYVVEAGDYPYLIAEKLGVDPEELIRLNNLEDPSGLYVGQVLKVPGSPQATAAPSGRTPTARPTIAPTAEPEAAATPRIVPTPSSGQTTYTVESGDSAADIAARFAITVEELAAANNTTVDDLRSLDIGDVLIIPAASAPPEEPPIEQPTEAPVDTPVPEP